MRALLLLALVAPLALAQPDVVDWIDAEIAPFAEPVAPLQAPKITTLATRVSCLLGDPAIAGVPITYTVVEPPAWLSATISPASDVAPLGQCTEGYTDVRSATITVTANERAPGFTPTPLVVEIAAGTAERERRESVSVEVSASFFSILDVQAVETQATIAPGGSHDFNVVVTNFGNARTRVEPVLTEKGDAIAVTLPSPLVLGSRASGDSDILGTLAIRVMGSDQGAFGGEAAVLSVRFNSYYADDGSIRGDTADVAFAVTLRSGAAAAAEKSSIASPALPLILAALVIGTAFARRPPR